MAQGGLDKPTYEEAIRCASYLTELSGSQSSAAKESNEPDRVDELNRDAEANRNLAMTWLSYSSLFGNTRNEIVADYRADRDAFSVELDSAKSNGSEATKMFLGPIGAKCDVFETTFGPNLTKLTGQ